jgi:membrane protease subunit HflK
MVVLFVAGYLLTGLTMVRPGERAVVRRFGRVLQEKPEPGLFIGLPWGMDRVDRVPVDFVRRVEVGYDPKLMDEAPPGSNQSAPSGQLLTGDHNLINLQVVLVYSIHEDEVEDYVVQADQVDAVVMRLAESALAEWVAARTVDDVILNAKRTLPGWIVRQTRERVKPYKLGIQIRDEASVSYLFPPREVVEAFDRVTQEQTAVETRRNTAEQLARQAVSEAEAERFRVVQQAKGYAREQKLLAAAEASRFDRRREQYHRLRKENPDFLAGIWWDSMAGILGKLRDSGRIDLIDNHVGGDGLDIIQFPISPKKK